MNNFIHETFLFVVGSLSHLIDLNTFFHFLFIFFPFVILVEIPFYIILLAAIFRNYLNEVFSIKAKAPYYPSVSCLVTCYSEGQAITRTLASLAEQLYRGVIEVLVIVDGAEVNKETLQAANHFVDAYQNSPRGNIQFKVIPKYTRGGHASSLNIGLHFAKNELIVILDGDCSCDNDAIAMAVESFANPDVVGLSGTLRARNARRNLVTCLQAVEYMLGIHFSRVGLGALNILNIVSGAFGIFRKDFIGRIGGWKSGSAEDLDLTLRIQTFFQKHPKLRLQHNPNAIVHTDVPETWFGLLRQRLRWDGDIFYIYFYRHWRIFRPKFLGWKGFIGLIWYVLLLHVALPLVIIFALTYLFIKYSLAFAISLLIVTYIYYLFLTILMFVVYLLLVSERKRYDCFFILFLPVMPIYQLVMRIWSAVAILAEIFLGSHRDSSMAPWWVNRKIH